MQLVGRRFCKSLVKAISLTSILALGCQESSDDNAYYYDPAPTQSSTNTQPVNNTSRQVNNPPETFVNNQYYTQDGKEFVMEFNGRDNDSGDRVVRYEYRVDGGNWSSWNETRLVIFTKPYGKGTHTVEIRSVDNSGLSDPTPSRVTFEGLKEENILTATTNSGGIGSISINGTEIDVKAVDSNSRAPISGINVEAVSYGNVVGTISKDPLGRYWPMIWPVRIDGRGKSLTDILLELEMQKISENRPYTIYTSKPLLDSETKLYLRYVDTLTLTLMIDYFKRRDELGKAVEIAEFINDKGGFQGENQLTLATNINKFRSQYIQHLPEIMNIIASIVGSTASPEAIYCDIHEQQSFVNTNTVSSQFNEDYTTARGRIISQEGTPVHGARISQIQPAGPSSVTNSNGEYFMYYVRTGNVTIKVESSGFETITDNGNIPLSWELKVFDYVMQKSKSQELRTLTIQPSNGIDTRIEKLVCSSCSTQNLFLEWPDSESAFVGRDEDPGNYSINRAYIKFDMSSAQGLDIEKVYLELLGTMRSDSGSKVGRIEVRRVSSGWSEGGLNWNNQPSFETKVQDAIDIDPGYEWRRWDITLAAISWVSGFANNGLLLTSADENWEGYFDFNTSDYQDQGLKPRLVIAYKE